MTERNESLFFGKPWHVWVTDYQQSHQNRLNQLCHMIGIPMILISLAILLAGIAIDGFFYWGLGLFILGWILQFVGHIAEGKPPEFFQDWRFMFVGVRWWYHKFVLGTFDK